MDEENNVNNYMRPKTAFNQKVQFFDKLKGTPGANTVLRNKFLDYVLSAAKSKTYFSNTTYSIIYKLIKNDKIGLFFNPSVKIREFFVSDEPVHVSGGYNFSTRKIEITVNWRYGYDAIFQLLRSYMPILCNKIFATILSEALLIYDYKHNGELSKHDKIKNWYYEYFRGIFGSILKQQNLANKLADIVSQNYGTRMYDRIENSLVEGTDPEIKVTKKGENPELDIEGIPLIKKNEKELHDIFSDTIEDYVNQYMNELGIDNHSGDQYLCVKKMFDDFGDFGQFLYKNRDLELNPKNIQENPDNDSLPVDKRIYDDEKNLTKYMLEKEAKEKEDREYQKYLNEHPKVKEVLDATENPTYDQLAEKYFGQLKDPNKIKMIEQKNPDGTITMIPQRSTTLAPSIMTYVNSKDNQDYISLFLLGKNCSSRDMKEAIEGVQTNLKCYRDSQRKLAEAIRKGDSQEKIRKLTQTYQLYEKQFKTTFPHLVQLFAEKSRGTINHDQFYKPALTSGSNNKSNTVETDYANAQTTIDNMRKALSDHSSSNRSNTLDLRSQLVVRKNNNEIKKNIDRLVALNAVISSDSSTQPEKEAAIKQFNALCNPKTGSVVNLIGSIGDKVLEKEISSTSFRGNPNDHLKYSDLIRSSDKKTVDSYLRAKDLYVEYNDKIKNFSKIDKIESINNGLFGNKTLHTNLNNLRNTKNTLNETDIFNVINAINQFGNSIKNDFKKLDKDRIINNKTGKTLEQLQAEFTNIQFGRTGRIKNSNDVRSAFSANKVKFLRHMAEIANDVNLTKNYIEQETRKKYSKLDDSLSRSTNIRVLQDFATYLKKRRNSYKTYMDIVEGRLKNRGPQARAKLLELLKGKNTDIIDAIDAQFLDDYTDPKDRKNAIALLKRLHGSFEAFVLPGKNKLALGNDSLLKRADNPEKDYYKLLFLNGLDYLRDCMPSWETIVDHFKNGYATAKHVAQTVKSIYRTVKVVLPLKSNLYPYMNQKFGFEDMADKDFFDLAYKLIFGIKKIYALKKYSVRHNMIYSEIFLPVSIFQKVLFVNITTQNDYDNVMLYLINCANKGLEEFI